MCDFLLGEVSAKGEEEDGFGHGFHQLEALLR
jgi:hypothetical protein